MRFVFACSLVVLACVGATFFGVVWKLSKARGKNPTPAEESAIFNSIGTLTFAAMAAIVSLATFFGSALNPPVSRPYIAFGPAQSGTWALRNYTDVPATDLNFVVTDELNRSWRFTRMVFGRNEEVRFGGQQPSHATVSYRSLGEKKYCFKFDRRADGTYAITNNTFSCNYW